MIRFKISSQVDLASKVVNDLIALTKKEVLVGVPEENDPRESGEPIGNAALAYIHDNGSPVAGIPARPFMEPGIKSVQDRINREFLAIAKAQLNHESEDVIEGRFEKIGLIAQNGIKKAMTEGEGFEPLARSTQLARLRKRKAMRKWSAERREEVMSSLRPLIDTGELRNSITYIVKDVEE